MHASTTSTGLVLLDGPRLHRCPVMPPEHVHDRGDGIRVTTPVRTMFDVAKHVSDLALISAIEQCLRRELFDPEWHLGTANASYDDRRDRQVRLGGGAVERVWTDEIEPMRVGLVGELLAAHRRQRDIWTRTRTAAV